MSKFKPEYYRPRAVDHVARLLEEGFDRDALFVTLGYLPGRQPKSRETAVYCFKVDFIQRMQQERKRQGISCAYLYGLRWELDGMPPEFRLVLSFGPESVEKLENLWPYGPVICRPLRDMGPLPQLASRLYLDALSGPEPVRLPIRHSTHLGPNCLRRRYQAAPELRKRLGME